MIKNTLAFLLYAILIFVNLLYGIYETKTYKKVRIKIGKLASLYMADIISLCLVICLMWIGFNAIKIPDYDSYGIIYYSGRYSTEIGYEFLQKLAISAGLSFECFRNINILVSLVCIWIGANKLCVNKNIIFALYAVYPFSFSVIQLRNGLSMAIAIIAFAYILKEQGYSKICFAILIL